jgi:hypothetical protein
MTGTATPGGALVASQPATVVWDGVIPSAPFVWAIDFAPGFSTGPGLLGEVLVPLPLAYSVQGTLDAAGMQQTTLVPALGAPALVGVPFYAQFAVFDAAAGGFRLSNGLVRIFSF